MAYLHDMEEKDVFIEDLKTKLVTVNPFLKGKWLFTIAVTIVALVLMIRYL